MHYAKQHLGELTGKRVLVIGAGKMGAVAARRLKAEGAGDIVLLNRSHKRAQDVASELGEIARVAEMPGLVDALRTADVVVTSTGASHFVLTPGNVAEAMLARPQRPLFIVDIAVPRDVDPDVARIPGVGVVDVDALKGVVDDTLEKRREAIPLVEQIIAEHVERFQQWYQSRVAVPVIASLTQKAESIRESELERLFARMPESHRARAQPHHRHVDDDRLEAAAQRDRAHPRQGGREPRRSADAREDARRAVRAARARRRSVVRLPAATPEEATE